MFQRIVFDYKIASLAKRDLKRKGEKQKMGEEGLTQLDLFILGILYKGSKRTRISSLHSLLGRHYAVSKLGVELGLDELSEKGLVSRLGREDGDPLYKITYKGRGEIEKELRDRILEIFHFLTGLVDVGFVLLKLKEKKIGDYSCHWVTEEMIKRGLLYLRVRGQIQGVKDQQCDGYLYGRITQVEETVGSKLRAVILEILYSTVRCTSSGWTSRALGIGSIHSRLQQRGCPILKIAVKREIEAFLRAGLITEVRQNGLDFPFYQITPKGEEALFRSRHFEILVWSLKEGIGVVTLQQLIKNRSWERGLW